MEKESARPFAGNLFYWSLDREQKVAQIWAKTRSRAFKFGIRQTREGRWFESSSLLLPITAACSLVFGLLGHIVDTFLYLTY